MEKSKRKARVNADQRLVIRYDEDVLILKAGLKALIKKKLNVKDSMRAIQLYWKLNKASLKEKRTRLYASR